MDTTVWKNGNILTMRAGLPPARAMIVRGRGIIFSGDEREALALAGGDAILRDLGGRTVIPGFNDNHVHAVFMGDHAMAPDLGNLDARQIAELLRDRFPDPEPGIVIRAFNWDYPACPEPRKETLDRAFPRNPVVLGQFSGHAQWLNSAALAILGIGKNSPDPVRGQVLRDPDGEPTGIVRDLGETVLSRMRVRQNYYRASVREPRLDLALATFRRYGITSVQDNTWYPPQIGSLARRASEGSLSARFSTWSLGRVPGTIRGIDRAFARRPDIDPDMISPGPVKFFLDGAFSTRTACLCEPYADNPATGICSDPAEPGAELEYLARSGRRGAFHIIGDRGIQIFLDTAEDVWKRHPGMKDRRIRIEHAQLIRPRDIERIARLGILVAAQPTALLDPEKDEKLLGPERALRAYPYRSLLDAGVRLSFGSDIPGESFCDPIRAIHLAVNREGAERIGVVEAIRCYTAGSAHAEKAEDRKGLLVPGMLADFVVLSEDPTAIPEKMISTVRVLETVVGGDPVWRATQE